MDYAQSGQIMGTYHDSIFATPGKNLRSSVWVRLSKFNLVKYWWPKFYVIAPLVRNLHPHPDLTIPKWRQQFILPKSKTQPPQIGQHIRLRLLVSVLFSGTGEVAGDGESWVRRIDAVVYQTRQHSEAVAACSPTPLVCAVGGNVVRNSSDVLELIGEVVSKFGTELDDKWHDRFS